MPCTPEFSAEFASGKRLSITEAARLVLPARGEKVAPSTITRWILYGKEGYKLEALRQPNGQWLTTAGAMERFLEAMTALEEAAKAPREKPPPAPTPDAEQLAADVYAKAALDAEGIGTDRRSGRRGRRILSRS